MKPMLCQPIDSARLLELVSDDRWAMSQKLDGIRLLVEVKDGKAKAFNRYGDPAPLISAVSTPLARTLPNGHFVLDCELLKHTPEDVKLMVFDLPMAGTVITPRDHYFRRLEALQNLAEIGGWNDNAMIGVLAVATDHFSKVRLVRRLEESNAEGVIIRRTSAPYLQGKRSPDLLKYKFIKDVDCVVMELGRDGKKNLVLGLYENGELKEVGACTALAGDGPGIRVGAVVTVKYLYASKDRRLIQPTYPVVRMDKRPEDCDFDQLVYTNKDVLDG